MTSYNKTLQSVKRINPNESITLGDDIIDFLQPLPEHSNGSYISAFAATHKNSQTMAYLLSPNIIPRFGMMEAQGKIDNPNLIQGQAYYPVIIGDSKKQQTIVITDRPFGIQLSRVEAREFFQTHKHIAELLIKPLVGVLKDFEELGLTHRAINPQMISFSDNTFKKMTLGAGFLTPPGFLQQSCYEPIQTCFCEPTARGAGMQSYDLYAIGITILSLFKDVKALQRLSTSESNKLRLSEGTYNTFIEKQIFSDRIMELLKGLICDDTYQRWTLNDLESWADFNKVHARYRAPNKSTGKSFSYNGNEYENPDLLLHQIGKDWIVTDDVLKTDELYSWMRRNSKKQENSEELREAQASAAKTEASIRNDAAMAYILIALNPENALYFRSLVFAIDGLADYLACNFHDVTARNNLLALLNSKAPLFWLQLQPQKLTIWLRLTKLYQEIIGFLNKRGMGFGLERCLYELNPKISCFSPLINHLAMYDSEDILSALDIYAKNNEGNLWKTMPIDRHLVAFAAARFDFIRDDFITTLPDEKAPVEQRIISAIRFLSLIEKNTPSKPLYDLYKWLHLLSEQSLVIYRSKNRREKIQKLLDGHKSLHPFDRLLTMIDNAAEKKLDMDEFMEAKKHHIYTVHKLKEWNFKLNNIRSVSRDMCDSFSILTAILSCFMITMMYLLLN